MKKLDKIIVVTGPTASGKSKFAINLAKLLNGEIISTDSMQVYRKFDIGTAKPTFDEQKLIPHHQIDLIEPYGHYSAGKFQEDSSKIIENINSRGNIPILVGGTGLYYHSLIYGRESH